MFCDSVKPEDSDLGSGGAILGGSSPPSRTSLRSKSEDCHGVAKNISAFFLCEAGQIDLYFKYKGIPQDAKVDSCID